MSRLRPNIDTSLFKLSHEQKASDYSHGSESVDSVPLQRVKEEFDRFERIDLSNDRHKQELLSMFPSYLLSEVNDGDWQLFLSMSRYDIEKETFVVGVYRNSSTDLNYELISYKHRRYGEGKWVTRKGTHPNNVPFIRIHRDSSMVYIVEGHHDMLTAILLGLDFIMIPTAGFKRADLIQKNLLDRDVTFLVEDRPSFMCMYALAQELTDVAKAIILREYPKSSSKQKFDLSDYAMKRSSKEEALHELTNYQ